VKEWLLAQVRNAVRASREAYRFGFVGAALVLGGDLEVDFCVDEDPNSTCTGSSSELPGFVTPVPVDMLHLSSRFGRRGGDVEFFPSRSMGRIVSNKKFLRSLLFVSLSFFQNLKLPKESFRSPLSMDLSLDFLLEDLRLLGDDSSSKSIVMAEMPPEESPCSNTRSRLANEHSLSILAVSLSGNSTSSPNKLLPPAPLPQ
jgi:hypothetical protein